MIAGWPILSCLIFLPLAGAALILSMRGKEEVVASNARALALWISLVTLLLAVLAMASFSPSGEEFQLQEQYRWFGGNPSYHVGVDGVALLFILLTTSLVPLCVLASTSITVRVKEYMAAFLVMETLMLGVFCALDLILFYLFFEGGLIPMFLIIGIWGGSNRVYASFKFFLYTLLGSLFMLLAIAAMWLESGTTSIVTLLDHPFAPSLQTWLWLAFFASFAVKLPMWPVHTWLPDAHVEAPTAGSVILAGVLLKLGGYGFFRFSLPIFPAASAEFAPFVFALSVIAVIYTSLVALAQEDLKKLVAYSSVAHMGFVTLGLFAGTQQGIEGGIFQMLSHGWISAALFLCVGVVYDRLHTREIAAFGGLVTPMPLYALIFMIFMLANIGLPGTSGFVGEVLIIFGLLPVSVLAVAVVVLGVILSAAYGLTAYARIMFGAEVKEHIAQLQDITRREQLVFAPLVLAALLFGLYPAPLLRVIEPAAERLIMRYDAGQTRAQEETRP